MKIPFIKMYDFLNEGSLYFHFLFCATVLGIIGQVSAAEHYQEAVRR